MRTGARPVRSRARATTLPPVPGPHLGNRGPEGLERVPNTTDAQDWFIYRDPVPQGLSCPDLGQVGKLQVLGVRGEGIDNLIVFQLKESL